MQNLCFPARSSLSTGVSDFIPQLRHHLLSTSQVSGQYLVVICHARGPVLRLHKAEQDPILTWRSHDQSRKLTHGECQWWEVCAKSKHVDSEFIPERKQENEVWLPAQTADSQHGDTLHRLSALTPSSGMWETERGRGHVVLRP